MLGWGRALRGRTAGTVLTDKPGELAIGKQRAVVEAEAKQASKQESDRQPSLLNGIGKSGAA